MPDLENLEDGRPYARDQVLGHEDLTRIENNAFETRDVILERHTSTGDFKDRQVTKVRGNYVYNSGTGKFDLQGQTLGGYLPSNLTPSAAGDVPVPFLTALPEDTYDVVVSGGLDSDGRPGQIGVSYDAAEKTTAQCRVLMTKNSSTIAENLDGFTITISFHPPA